ncbi:Peptidyl-tRNA hydrolase ArfB [compost metagenome]
MVLKAQQARSLETNKEEALRRLQELVDSVAVLAKPRRATRPTRSSQRKRLDGKTKDAAVKKLRGKVEM